VQAAAGVANAHDFINAMSNGYATFVGDRGVKLSGGQRQRIAIARAVAGDPEILIFDEATSSLDTDSERQVQLAIEEVLKNSTAIVIAHRLSTVLNADRIVVIDKGIIEAEGSHHQLLERSPIYCRLYEMQFRTKNSLEQ
jgi:ABC-type multidrug transport system fused ATPase/permease subunit